MKIQAGEESAFLELARAHLGDELAEQLWALRKSGVHLHVGSRVAPGRGGLRFGGNPLLDPGTEWPVWRGRPLSFVALLDLTQLSPFAEATGLPAHGYLNVFYATDDPDELPWGEEAQFGGWRVIPSDPSVAVETTAPGSTVWNAFAVEPVPAWTLPTPEESMAFLEADDEDGLEERLELLMEEWDYSEEHTLDGALHLIGGWPNPVQTHIPIFEDIRYHWAQTPYSIADDDIQLLLQLENDSGVTPASRSSTAHFTMTHDWSWGDAGSIYFVASSADLAQGAFERVVLCRQTY